MSPEYRRRPLYFHAPDFNEMRQTVGDERWHYITRDIFVQYWSQPSMELLRMFFGSILWELYNQPQEARDSGYDDLQILYSIAIIQELTTRAGILLGKEVEKIHKGMQIEKIDPSTKYATWEELITLTEQWTNSGESVGIVHGAFDPVHAGHSNSFTRIWPYSDKVIVGFDPNWLIKERKGVDRPRFPQLAWRMWEAASLPTVDKVFVLPFASPDRPTSQDFYKIYQNLRVTVLGTDSGNPLVDEYKQQMATLGGYVITGSDEVDLPKMFSSTLMFDFLQQTTSLFDPNIENAKRWANITQAKALSFGYLRDYPGGTS